LYLANGDILLAGPVTFDLNDTRHARRNCRLFVLDAAARTPPTPLGVKANEGPAVSRTRMHVAWTDWHDPEPGDERFYTRIFVADVSASVDGRPHLSNQRKVLDSRELDIGGAWETQNFRPPHERQLTLSLYTDGGRQSDIAVLDLETGDITRMTATPDFYEEAEGIYPDGTATLVEADLHNGLGPRHVDWWKFPLEGDAAPERLTFFSEFENYKCSNPVVSDDGRFIAGQLAKAGDDYGVGHGLILYNIAAARAAP
jgi:Tol biopolymer transport system component